MLPTKKTFFLIPEEYESMYFRITVEIHYDTFTATVYGHLNPITIDLKTSYNEDPIHTLLSYDKNTLLSKMGLSPNIDYKTSYGKTMINAERELKRLKLDAFHLPYDTYEELMKTGDIYSDEKSFNALCSIINKHSFLSLKSDTIIEKVLVWPEYYETVANILIEKLYPILKTVPTISTNAILIEK